MPDNNKIEAYNTIMAANLRKRPKMTYCLKP